MSKILSFLLAFSLYIPYRFFGDKEGAISFTFTDLIVFTYFIYTVIKILTHKNIKIKSKFIIKFKFIFITTIILFLLNYIAFKQTGYYISMTKELILALGLYIVLNSETYLFRNNQKDFMLYGFLLGGLINSLLSIAQIFFGNLYIQKSTILSYKMDLYGEVISNPIIGFFPHTNSNAYMIILCLVVCMYILKNKIIKILCTLINLVALYGTQSKGAFILCAIIFIAYFFIKNRKKLAIKYKLITFFSILQIYFLYFLSWYTYLPELGTFRDRILFQSAFIRLIIDNPLIIILGNGTSQMEYYTSIYSRYSIIYSHASFLDNILLLGLVGIMINYFILNRYFRIFKISEKYNESNKLIILILMLFVLIYISFIEPMYMTQPVTYIVAILIFNSEQVLSNKKI